MAQQRIVELGRSIVDDVKQLVQLEIQLARQEIREMVVADVKAAAFLLIAGVLAFVALIFGLGALAFLLGNFVLSPGWWFFIFFVLFLVIAAVLALLGKRRLRFGPPRQTLDSLREDVEWARLQIKRNP